MNEKSNIKILKVPTKEGMEQTLKIFNLRMKDAHTKSAELLYENTQWSPFKRRDFEGDKNGQS